MNFRNAEFLIQEAFTGIRRNGLMAFASVTTIALSLAVLGAFALMALGANHFAQTHIGGFEIAVFIKPEAGQAGTEEIARTIRKMKFVRSATIKDRAQEWANLKREQPDFETAGFDFNKFPYSIGVKLADQSRTALVAARIRTMRFIDKVNDLEATLGRVMTAAHLLRVVSVVGVAVLLVTAVFIISNAIKLTLYARRREISIMQLVGATNWFIRVPLVVEGIVFGAVGAGLAWVLLHLGSGWLSSFTGRMVKILSKFSSGVEPAQLVAGLVILGAAIGAIGSFVSIHRFLRD